MAFGWWICNVFINIVLTLIRGQYLKRNPSLKYSNNTYYITLNGMMCNIVCCIRICCLNFKKTRLLSILVSIMLSFTVRKLTNNILRLPKLTNMRHLLLSTTKTLNPTRCIEKMEQQHVVIKETLNAFENCNETLKSHPSEDYNVFVDDLQKFIRFFKEYVDEIHSYMEEEIIFPPLKDYGFSVVLGHGGIYLENDHDLCRQYVTNIANGINSVDKVLNDPQSSMHTIDEFIPFLELHADKEDKILFPDIISKVPQSAMEEISKECDKFMDENKGKEEELEKISDDLIKKYGKEKKKEKTNPFAYFEDI